MNANATANLVGITGIARRLVLDGALGEADARKALIAVYQEQVAIQEELNAAYVADSRFRVNLVSPGGILDKQPDSFLQAYQHKTLGKGMLDPTDVTGAIAFLLSDHARFINGQNIVVDDGFTLCG